jgi:hypothetical protein
MESNPQMSFFQKMLVIIFAGLFIPAGYSISEGAEWKLFYKNESGEEYLFDKASIEYPEKGVVRVWQKTVEKTRDGEEQEKSKLQIEIYCSSKRSTYTILSNTEEKTKKDAPIRSEDIKGNPPASYIPSGVTIGALRDNVCP